MKKEKARLTIGQIANRTGLSVSAIRFYETQGLVKPIRKIGGQRRYVPSDIRRLSFVLIVQQLGFPLDEIASRIKNLPDERTPNENDWAQISREFRDTLQDRISIMTRLMERLDTCIGCGCLSLEKCSLYNPDDRARRFGVGPRYLLGDAPELTD